LRQAASVARAWFRDGNSLVQQLIAQAADATGQLSIPDPKLAALQFLALITAEVRMPSLLGILGPMDDAAAMRAADAGVQVFLPAYRPDPLACDQRQ
jgi:TetR/AcrR family transcriptional regulator, mexJK operon transcriptional repressor